MSGDAELIFELEQWLAAHGYNVPHAPITSDPLATGGSTISQLLALLGAAANGGDPADNTNSQMGQTERDAKIADAQAKFPANEEQSAAKLAGVGDPSQMAQQIPQMASGIAGGISGALGGALQPLSQIPQQLSQAGQQAMQMGMGALQPGAGGGAAAAEALPGELLGAEGGLGGAAGELASAGGGGFGGTMPTAMLGPPPTPSAGTVPASSPTTPPAPPSTPQSTTAPRGAMGAMPMMPPGAMHGAGGPGSDAKPDTKRVVAPSVKNGGPVQGRITTPPPAPQVTKRVAGKPVATKRILLPDVEDDGTDPGR